MKLIKKALSFIPDKMGIPLICCLLWNLFVFYFPRIFTSGGFHYYMNLPIDDSIPLIPWTIIIYYGSYLFWGITYIMACRREKDEAYRFLATHFLAETVCLVAFFVLPTQLVRPEINGGGIWNAMLKMLYLSDSPDNLFPSLHCMLSWICCIGVRKNPNVPVWYRIFAHIITLAICISTLTTKQHVFVDTVSGIAVAEICYRITDISGFTSLIRRIFDRQRKNI